MEYICFFHPRVKGYAADDLCRVCGRSFDFPTINSPTEIADFNVEEALGRGFYSVAFRVRHRITGILSVLKVTSAFVYENPDPIDPTLGGFGDRRNFLIECQLHADVSQISQVASIQGWGETTADFGGESLKVNWSQMELIRGNTIESYFEGPALPPRTIAQIAEDLLRFSERMNSAGIHHNDLHGGNAVLVNLAPEDHRRSAIEPTVALRVFDLGSASHEDKSDERRLSDLEQISAQMIRLLDQVEGSNAIDLLPSDIRLIAQLRKVAQYHRRSDWSSRRPTTADMIDAIRRAFEIAVHPELRQAPGLQSMQEHYNAQTLPPELSRALIYDPEGAWTRELTGAGPQLLVGMRGCGKTHLLRSLEWAAHATVAPNENLELARERLRKQNYLGLFVSCAYLLKAPRERVGSGALQRLYLAYAREAIRSVSMCEIKDLGNVRFDAVEAFCQQIGSLVPTFRVPDNSTSLHSIERELSKAVQLDVPTDVQDGFVPMEAFASLAESIRGLVDIWSNRTILFLLDDVSKRFVHDDDLEDLLTQFCLRSDSFGFKISTETQVQLLYSPSGQPALEGRDYQVFNLGTAVLEQLGGSKGIRFLEEVLDKRQRQFSSYDVTNPNEILGRCSLAEIAEGIRSTDATPARSGSGRNTYQYFGLDALAALCVGDLGDVLQIFHRISASRRRGAGPVSAAEQSKILRYESTSRLLSLVSLDAEKSWFYSHAVAFAQASHRELASRTRLRQYSDLYIEIDSSNSSLFNQLMALVDNGLYVIVGFRQRSKSANGVLVYQFRLKYRKLLGLTFGMPLANRDRFELTGASVEKWLTSPSSNLLSTDSDDEIEWPYIWDSNEEASKEPETSAPKHGQLTRTVQPTLFDSIRIPENEEQGSESLSFPSSTSHRSSCQQLPLADDSLPWQQAAFVTACGFEDRALGMWKELNLRISNKISVSVLLRYEDHGNYGEILDVASESSDKVITVDVETATDPTDFVERILESFGGSPVILDVSCMTKPLIYAFTKATLLYAGEVWIIHTAAEFYDPSDDDLRPVLEMLNNNSYPEGLHGLDKVTPGEGSHFTPLVIGQNTEDASSRSILACFVTLKHKRLESLLSVLATDKIVGIKSVHTSGRRNTQGRIIDLISRYLVSSRNGELPQVGAMDAQSTYVLLDDYYQRYVLDGSFRMELALTGTKLQTVGAAMFAAVAKPACVYYAIAHNRDRDRFTHGVGETKLFRIATESRDSAAPR